MHIRKTKDVDNLLSEKAISPALAERLKRELEQSRSPASVQRASGQNRRAQVHSQSSESDGERSLRLALTNAFGLWEYGGEVVPELMPFPGRKIRADFSLPRFRIYCEVDGWSHHGKSLDDHHADRARGMYFAARDWLAFHASHQQATQDPFSVVEAVKMAIAIRSPIPREDISIEVIQTPKQTWHRLHWVDS